jgi:hypothetical protein
MTFQPFDWETILPALSKQPRTAIYSARGDCGQCGEYTIVVLLALSGSGTQKPGLLTVCASCLVALATAMRVPIALREPLNTIYNRYEEQELR